MTVGDERAARGTRGAHRAARHRGVHRPRGARPPGPGRAVPAVRRPPAAARAGRAARRRARAHGPGRRAARARRGRAARGARRAATPRRPPSACCGGSATPSTSGASASCSRRRCPASHVSTSHETAGVFREYERCATTIVDAALSPLLRGYLERLTERAARRRPARARGDAVERRHGRARPRRPRHALVDRALGPGRRSGGRRSGRRAAGARDAVGLDMGGTSCDVSLIVGGAAAVGSGREVGGRRAGAADGGRPHGRRRRRLDRLARRRAARCAWGRGRRAPTRARPATAAAASEPTVTDANLLLGPARAEDAPLAGGVRARPRRRPSGRWASWPTSSASAARTRRGHRPRGRAPRWPARARRDGRARHRPARPRARAPSAGPGRCTRRRSPTSSGCGACWCPRARGVLSALGLVVAERRRDVVESVLLAGDDARRPRRSPRPSTRLGRARPRASSATPRRRAARHLRAALRGARPSSCRSTASPAGPRASCARPSTRAHEERYGYRDPDAKLELVTIRVTAAVPGRGARRRGAERGAERGTRAGRVRRRGARGRVLGAPGRARARRAGARRAARVDARGAARLDAACRARTRCVMERA